MKKLIIAEKPSVARDIARVLKCSSKGKGYLYNDTYIISWAVGHLVTLCDAEDYDPKYKRWKNEDLPIIPDKLKIKAIEQTRDQLVVLHSLIKSDDVDSLICATDSGREGELIFRYIYEITNCDKPFKRLWISSMTDAAIKDGFAKLKDGSEYDLLYKSARCRSEADWLVGINASRAFTIKYNTLLSIGRVQTPTLAMIVQRQKEIDEFEVKPYWEIEADFGSYKGTWFNKTDNETKFFEKEKAQEIADKVKKKKGIVSSIDKEEKKQPAPLLYDLTELQRECNKKYGFSAQKTLSIAQDLYEKRKMITYPRTDSRYLSDDMIPKMKIVLGKLKEVNEYSGHCEYVLGLEKLPITKRIVDNSKISDHHAIIPTESRANVNALSADEMKVYDLIARRFIAVFYPNYIYSTTKITSTVENENFMTKGTTVIQKGWTEVDKPVEKDKEKTEILPDVAVNDEVTAEKVSVASKKTKPPQAYTEAALLSSMENAGRFVEDEVLKEQLKESGLGTPATRAAIIEKLLNVGYITRKGKKLTPTEKGKNLIAVVPPELKSPVTTGKWEKGLSSISKGNMEPEKFMGSIVRYVNYIVRQSVSTPRAIEFPKEERKGRKSSVKKESMGVCPNCSGEIYENSKGYYCSNWQDGCKFTIWKNSLESVGINIDNEFVKKILKDKKCENIEITLQTGEKQTVCVEFLDEKKGNVKIIDQ
ncbi:MAG: DNA topoisomerase III [Firmicutes bacterium]|nr:DNA topoisomerase III [Bacillota bacterium]